VRGITIAIDGPAASGKSTTARAVAEELGYHHLNSGTLYRAITWAALEEGWIDDERRFRREVGDLDLRLERDTEGYRITIGGRDAGDGLVSPGTASRVSEVSAREATRQKVLGLLRAEADRGAIVCDGRDIGTVVFPDAELKIFLVASAEERGRRRLLEMGAKASPDRVREEASLLEARDRADSSRNLAPLRKARDAIELDTTDLEASEVVDRIVALARAAGATVG
jgi:cytidylate kinase